MRRLLPGRLCSGGRLRDCVHKDRVVLASRPQLPRDSAKMSNKEPEAKKEKTGTGMWSTIPWPPAGGPYAPVLITSNLPTFRPIGTKRSTPFDPVAAERRWSTHLKQEVPETSSPANPIVTSSDDCSDGKVPSLRDTIQPTRWPSGPIRASNVETSRQPMSDLYDSDTEPSSSRAANSLPCRFFTPVYGPDRPAFSPPTSGRPSNVSAWSPTIPSHHPSNAPGQLTPSNPPNPPAPSHPPNEPTLRPEQQEVVELTPSNPPNPPASSHPPNEPALSPEQQEVVELAAQGHNIFYTGSAGCGKSTVLHAIRRRLQEMGKNVHVIAPTGIAALAIDGTTTWRYAGWGPDSFKRPLQVLKKSPLALPNQRVRNRLLTTDVLIIDEISMIENLFFQRLSEVLRYVRSFRDPGSEEPNAHPENAGEAFGGIQVIVTGDFCQLPPVKPFKNCLCGRDLIRCQETGVYKCSSKKGKKGKKGRNACEYGTYNESDKWAFRSEAWGDCNFRHIHLRTIYRQSDSRFVKMLQNCRTGRPLSRKEVNLLMAGRPVSKDAVRLFPRRQEVEELNRKQFALLKDTSRPFPCLDFFRPSEKVKASEMNENTARKLADDPQAPVRPPLCVLKDHRFDELVELKAGMLVVLLANIDFASRLCNGSQGVIAGFEPYDQARLPKRKSGKEVNSVLISENADLKEAGIIQYSNQAKAYHKFKRAPRLGWPIVRFHNGITRTIYPECMVADVGDESPYSTLCRTQLPLAPAWALSVHKSQGMTLERVVVNLESAFEAGQVYVALSRAKSLEGLRVEGKIHDLQTGLAVNIEVQEFLEKWFPGQEDRAGSGKQTLPDGCY